MTHGRNNSDDSVFSNLNSSGRNNRGIVMTTEVYVTTT
jgi:hypothetical protein